MHSTRSRVIAVAQVLACIGALAISAQAKFYLGPVPHTLQTYVLFVMAFAAPPCVAIVSVVGYLALGALGAPVFAGGSLFGPSGGYLLGFLPAVLLLSAARESFVRFALACIGALGIIYVCGLAQLAMFVPVSELFALGIKPFILLDLLKAIAAALSMLQVRKFINEL